MAMANLDIIAPLLRFWASIKTCTPFPECSAPNTHFDKAAHIFAKEIVSIVLDMLNPKDCDGKVFMPTMPTSSLAWVFSKPKTIATMCHNL
jgi:hypothetical protein